MDRHNARSRTIARCPLMARVMTCACLLLGVAGCGVAEQQRSKDEVIADAMASSVQLFTERGDQGRRAGSAVVLAVDHVHGRALLLTTNHLLDPPADQRVYAAAPLTGERLEARILQIDEDFDLAILETKPGPWAPVRLRDESRLGDDVWVVAYPWGRQRTVIRGVVSQIASGNEELDSVPIEGPVRLIDASVSYGMSGGGVFDQRTGELVGIVRGYRSAKLALPGTGGEALTLPVAGETTVIAAPRIRCFLAIAAIDPGTLSAASETCLN